MSFKINILLLLFLPFLTEGQTVTDINARSGQVLAEQFTGIKIGEKVPDVLLSKVLEVNGELKSQKISDYNDRLLILDFMYTTCTACLAGLVEKEHLQRQFGNNIKIMAVVGGEAYAPGMLKREDESFIRKFLTNKTSYLSRNKVQIPWVVENKLLNQYFPHQLVSHVVWINKGIVIAITEQGYVDQVNIQSVLANKRIDLPVKNDFLPPVDAKTPLVLQNKNRFTGVNPINLYTAVFGPYQDGVITKVGSTIDTLSHTRRDFIINQPVINAYITQWNLDSSIKRYPEPSRVILEVQDSSKYIIQEDSKEYNYVYRQRTYICYESLYADSGQTVSQVSRKIIKDLDNLLDLKGRYEKRRMKCLILYRTDRATKFKSTGKSSDEVSNLTAPEVLIKNVDLENSIVWKLNQFYGNPPVFDETGYKGGVEMNFSLKSWQDIESVRKALQKYGLDLKEEERTIEVFVLSELKK